MKQSTVVKRSSGSEELFEATRLMDKFTNHPHTRKIKEATHNCLDEIINALESAGVTKKVAFYKRVKKTVDLL